MKQPVETPTTIEVTGPSRLVGQRGMLEVIDLAREQVEREMIRAALAQTHGNAAKAAKLLKISYRCLQYKIVTYGIERP